MGRTDVGESGLDEDSPESKESSEGALDTEVLHEWSRVVPLHEQSAPDPSEGSLTYEAESEHIVVRSSSGVKDHTKDDQARNCQHFNDRKPELHLHQISTSIDVAN